jgi:hypothetical protein
MKKSVDISKKLGWGNSSSSESKSTKQKTPAANSKSTQIDKPMPSQKQMMDNASETTKPKKVEKHAV